MFRTRSASHHHTPTVGNAEIDLAPEGAANPVRRPKLHRRLATISIGLAAGAAILMGFAGTASASVAPVGYATGAIGNAHCYSTFNGNTYGLSGLQIIAGQYSGTTYSYVDIAPPTRAYIYPGTYNITFTAALYEYINGQWHPLNETQTALARNSVNVGGWYQVGAWQTDNRSVGDFEMSASPGAYFSAVETTAWLNSAGHLITSYSNSTNIALC